MISSSSKLLINESPLVVSPSLAVALGNINEAIILQQLQYWLTRSKKTYNNRKWIYNPVRDWQKQFPWLSKTAITNRLNSLEEKGIIITANLNKRRFDRTKWYSIDYDKLNSLIESADEPENEPEIEEKPVDNSNELSQESDKSNDKKVVNGDTSNLQKDFQESCNSHLQESCKPIPIDYQETTTEITTLDSSSSSSSKKSNDDHNSKDQKDEEEETKINSRMNKLFFSVRQSNKINHTESRPTLRQLKQIRIKVARLPDDAFKEFSDLYDQHASAGLLTNPIGYLITMLNDELEIEKEWDKK